MSPAEHIISEGVLSDIPVGKLDPKSSTIINVAVTFLAPGSFEFSAAMNAIGRPLNERTAGRCTLTVIVWNAPEAEL